MQEYKQIYYKIITTKTNKKLMILYKKENEKYIRLYARPISELIAEIL